MHLGLSPRCLKVKYSSSCSRLISLFHHHSYHLAASFSLSRSECVIMHDVRLCGFSSHPGCHSCRWFICWLSKTRLCEQTSELAVTKCSVQSEYKKIIISKVVWWSGAPVTTLKILKQHVPKGFLPFIPLQIANDYCTIVVNTLQ